MQSVLANSRLDQLGVAATSVCAVHCALGAAIAGASGFAGSLVADPRIETVLVLSAVLLAVLALSKGYRRHRDRWVLSLFVGGLSFLGIGHLLEVSLVPEHMFTVAAGGLLIGAHARNARVLHRLRACCGPAGCAAP